jgi:chromosome segregation ATPase
MSQSIDHVKIQIPGTMYYLRLTADRGRWILSLLLRNDVENEVVVPVFSKSGITKAANELLNNSRLVIDKYPLKNVCDQLYEEAERSLPTSMAPSEEIVDTTDFEEFSQKLDLLDNTLKNLDEELKEMMKDIDDRLDSLENERVARLEAELSNSVAKADEEIISGVSERLDQIEEAIAQTKGDDRVPSILTAIEALESKLSMLEGKAVTAEGGEPVTASNDIVNLKNDIARLAQAFDTITQRLTALESKLSKPAPIEGASDIQPPTT